MDSSCLVLDSLIQESNLLLEEQKQLMLEDARILNENLTDFLKSIKDVANDRLQSLIKRKYSQLEDIQKKNEAILDKNGVKISKIKSIIEGTVSSARSQLETAGKKGDKNLFQKAISSIIKKIKDLFERNKNLFGWKSSDPTDILVPLAITIVIITLKALILFLALWVVGPGLFVGSAGAIISQLLLLFIAIPLVEEAGKFFAIKTDSGGKYLIMFNAADFALTMFALPGTILVKIVMRLISAVSHAATYAIQKQGKAVDDHELAFRNAYMINAIRNFFEILFVVMSKTAEVASKPGI